MTIAAIQPDVRGVLDPHVWRSYPRFVHARFQGQLVCLRVVLEDMRHLLGEEARAVSEERRGLRTGARCQVAIASCRWAQILVLQRVLVDITVQERGALTAHCVEDWLGTHGFAPQKPARYLQGLVCVKVCLAATRPLDARLPGPESTRPREPAAFCP